MMRIAPIEFSPSSVLKPYLAGTNHQVEAFLRDNPSYQFSTDAERLNWDLRTNSVALDGLNRLQSNFSRSAHHHLLLTPPTLTTSRKRVRDNEDVNPNEVREIRIEVIDQKIQVINKADLTLITHKRAVLKTYLFVVNNSEKLFLAPRVTNRSYSEMENEFKGNMLCRGEMLIDSRGVLESIQGKWNDKILDSSELTTIAKFMKKQLDGSFDLKILKYKQNNNSLYDSDDESGASSCSLEDLIPGTPPN